MSTPLPSIRRSLASFLLAGALAAPLASIAPAAHAQFAQRLPSPVAATELESLLRGAGLDPEAIARALPLHETYFQSFREFEEREVDASLRNADTSMFGRPMTVDEARQNADMRRRLFTRAAQIDGQLVDQIAALLQGDAQAQALRNSLARRRAVAAIPTTGFGRGAHAFDLRSAPALVELDPAARTALAASFETYEQELTRQLERLAEASFVRRVRAAEAREELGVPMAPEPSGDVDPNAPPGAEERDWMRKMGEVQRRAGEESAQIDARIRKLHRDTLAIVTPMLPAATASALRAYLIREVYPAAAISGEFDAARGEAEAVRAKGALDDGRWAEIAAIIESHQGELRGELDAYLSKLDEQAASGNIGFAVADEPTDAQSGLDSARDRCNAIIARNAASLRAALGQAVPAPREAVAGRGVDVGAMTMTGGVQIAVVGGDGEAMVLGPDDLADSGMVLGGLLGGGGGGGIAKPMSGEELDRLAERLGFVDGTRVVFDEIVADCAEARVEAERADDAKKPPAPEPTEGGMATFSISIGEDGAMALGESGPADVRALALAVETAEERMFDGLKAAADASKAEAAEAARRARARTRLLVGERGPQSADIVAIVEAASLDETQRAAIAADVREWDESSVAMLRTMRDEVTRAGNERERLLAKLTQQQQVEQGNGDVRVERAMQIDADTMQELDLLERRIRDARDLVVARNRAAVETLASRLESSPVAVRAIRRGFYRVLEPGAYRVARDLEPFFVKGSAVDGLKPEARAKIDALRAEWIESRETLCEKFVEEREQERAKSAADGPQAMLGMAGSQSRKRLSADLEQLETTTFRRLRELLVAEVGAESAASIGDLPAKRKRGAPTIQFGG